MDEYIPAKVAQLGWDEHFIVATTKPFPETDDVWHIWQIYENSRNPSWWIAHLKSTKPHGPLSEADFSAKTKEVSVPNEVQLMSIRDPSNKSHVAIRRLQRRFN
jgi:hypothetical protein